MERASKATNTLTKSWKHWQWCYLTHLNPGYYSKIVLDVCKISGGNVDECFNAIVEILKKEVPNLKYSILREGFDTSVSNNS